MFFNAYTEAEIQQLIINKVDENLHLEYKAAAALAKSNRAEISKDISSFANADGGTIIYGVSETASASGGPKQASGIDPIDGSNFKKEQLDQIIDSNIQPRINGLVIKVIPVAGAYTHSVVYVVEIPKSTTAHQASHKKYHKRLNFTTDAMEDYEIRDVMNRLTVPQLVPIALPTFSQGEVKIKLVVANQSLKLAKEVQVWVEILTATNMTTIGMTGFSEITTTRSALKKLKRDNDLRVYYKLAATAGILVLAPTEVVGDFSFIVSVFADMMYPVEKEFKFQYKDGKVTEI